MSFETIKIYEPQEDSFMFLYFLQSFFKNQSKELKICEVGVGSGYLISNIAGNFSNFKYYGSDINEFAVKITKQKLKEKNILGKIELGNLFEKFNDLKFDVIFFNTPYLPLEDKEKLEDLEILDRAIYGGKKGYETIFEFIDKLNDKLENSGIAFILFSSYSHLDKICNKLDLNNFKFKIEVKKDFFFESLYILRIEKNDILKQLSSFNLENISYLTSGKHSKVYLADYKDKQVIIKYAQKNVIQKEKLFLDKLSKKKYIPKIYFSDENFIVLEKINGFIPKEVFINLPKSDILFFLNSCLEICFDLDQELIQKFELTNPYKHIFYLDNLEVKFIDFERSIFSENPKNTRQFLQFILRNQRLLEKKEILLNTKKIREYQILLKTKKIKIDIYDLIL